jgi:excisionase family DNA binding protein
MLLSPKMDVGYLTKREAAEYTRVSIATLERLMRKGLPHIKLERRVLFRREDIDRWLESKTVRKART